MENYLEPALLLLFVSFFDFLDFLRFVLSLLCFGRVDAFADAFGVGDLLSAFKSGCRLREPVQVFPALKRIFFRAPPAHPCPDPPPTIPNEVSPSVI